MQVFNIETDEYMRSTLSYGTRAFPFAYYYDEINRYHENAIEWHWHNGMELSMVVAGPVECYIGNKKTELNSGDAIFINHGVIHRFVSHSGGVMANFIFDSDFIAPIGSVIHLNYVLPVLTSSVMYTKIDPSTRDGREIIDMLIRAQNEAEIQGSAWELRLKSHILDAWCSLYEMFVNGRFYEGETTKRDNRTYARIRIMLNYIHMHYDENVSLEQIAASTSISKSEALRCFRTVLDTTPITYLTQYRLSRAEDLLLKGEDSVLQVALKCGFDNSSYFCKVFKRNIGMSPVEFTKTYSDDMSAM